MTLAVGACIEEPACSSAAELNADVIDYLTPGSVLGALGWDVDWARYEDVSRRAATDPEFRAFIRRSNALSRPDSFDEELNVMGGLVSPRPRGGANPRTRAAAGRGSTLHSDRPGHLPDQLRARYPETQFEFTKPGQRGQDALVVGGTHPSQYPGSTWPAGVNRADFKPGTPSGAQTFRSDQRNKWTDPTHMLPYDPETGQLR